MNLLEHYIVKIHSVEDVTKDYEKRIGVKPNEPVYMVDLTYDCYGKIKREAYIFCKSKFEQVKKRGYFMA